MHVESVQYLLLGSGFALVFSLLSSRRLADLRPAAGSVVDALALGASIVAIPLTLRSRAACVVAVCTVARK